MKYMTRFIVNILFLSFWFTPWAVTIASEEDPLSTVDIRHAPGGVTPGGRLPIGIRFKMSPGWHTYAEDPGDSGMPPDIRLVEAPDVVLESWQFPPAQTFEDPAGTTYGYEDQVVIIGAAHLPESWLDGQPKVLNFAIDWMVCKDMCVPLHEIVELTISVAPPADRDKAFREWKTFLKTGGWSADLKQQQEVRSSGKD